MDPRPNRPLTGHNRYGKLPHSKIHGKYKVHAKYAASNEDRTMIESQPQFESSATKSASGREETQTSPSTAVMDPIVAHDLTSQQLKLVHDTLQSAYGIDIDWFLAALGCSNLLEFAHEMGYVSESQLCDEFFDTPHAVLDCQVLLFYNGCRDVFEYRASR